MNDKVVVKLDRTERYPVYGLTEFFGVEVSVEVEVAERWHRALDAFEAVQDEMSDAYAGRGE